MACVLRPACLHGWLCSGKWQPALLASRGEQQPAATAHRQVFKGKWRGHHEVAIKQLTSFADDMLLSALEKEIGILKRVSFNRNIVQFYGFCLEVEAPMLVRDSQMFGYFSQVGRRRCIRRPLLCTLGGYCNP